MLEKMKFKAEMGYESNTRIQPKLLEQEERKAHIEEMRLKRNKFFQESMRRDGLTAKQLKKKRIEERKTPVIELGKSMKGTGLRRSGTANMEQYNSRGSGSVEPTRGRG